MDNSQNDKDVITSLLQPLASEKPAGSLLRYEGTYDKIKEARREDETLPRGIWEKELKKANWGEVAALCERALREQTKDLQIASWLAQAWIYIEGLAGLNKGLKLITALCNQFWEHLHPQIDGEDIEYRMAPLEWANEHLAEAIRILKITLPQDTAIPSFSLADMGDAAVFEKNARRQKESDKLIQQAQNEGRPTMQQINLSINNTPAAFFQSLLAQAKAGMENLTVLEETLNKLAPNYPFSFYRIRSTLEEIYRHCRASFSEPIPPFEAEEAPSSSSMPEQPSLPSKPTSETYSLPPISSRAEAYARLNQVAEYLLQAEPHSPTPYLVKRAASWGKMSLGELYQEIMQEEKEVTFIKQLLGGQALKKDN